MPSYIVFIPTPHEDIDAFFELAPVSSGDTVYDLGSGDGRLLFAAIEAGAGKAVGVELDKENVHDARESAKAKGLEGKVTFLEADVLNVNLSEATVVLCYLNSLASSDLKPKFEGELKPGTRIVMEHFPVREWTPERTVKRGYKQFYLYTIPHQQSIL